MVKVVLSGRFQIAIAYLHAAEPIFILFLYKYFQQHLMYLKLVLSQHILTIIKFYQNLQ